MVIHGNSGQYGLTPKSIAYGLGSAENVGKFNAKPVASGTVRGQENSAAATSKEVIPEISMEDFLIALSDNLRRLSVRDNEGNRKDIQPLLNEFKSAINQIEDLYGSEAANKLKYKIAEGIEKYGAGQNNMVSVLENVLTEVYLQYGLSSGMTQDETLASANRLSVILNGGQVNSLMGQAASGGLAKALSDFYGSAKSDQQYILTTSMTFNVTAGEVSLSSRQQLLRTDAEYDPYYYSEVAEEYYAGLHQNRGPLSSGFIPHVSAYQPEEAYEQVQVGDLRAYLLHDQWYGAQLQATAMADARPDLKPLERINFISVTTRAIVNGEIKYEPTEQMRQQVEMYSQLKQEYKAIAQALDELTEENQFSEQALHARAGKILQDILQAGNNSSIVMRIASVPSAYLQLSADNSSGFAVYV